MPWVAADVIMPSFSCVPGNAGKSSLDIWNSVCSAVGCFTIPTVNNDSISIHTQTYEQFNWSQQFKWQIYVYYRMAYFRAFVWCSIAALSHFLGHLSATEIQRDLVVAVCPYRYYRTQNENYLADCCFGRMVALAWMNPTLRKTITIQSVWIKSSGNQGMRQNHAYHWR